MLRDGVAFRSSLKRTATTVTWSPVHLDTLATWHFFHFLSLDCLPGTVTQFVFEADRRLAEYKPTRGVAEGLSWGRCPGSQQCYISHCRYTGNSAGVRVGVCLFPTSSLCPVLLPPRACSAGPHHRVLAKSGHIRCILPHVLIKS